MAAACQRRYLSAGMSQPILKSDLASDLRAIVGEQGMLAGTAVRERGLDILLWNVEAQDMEREDTYTMYTELVHQLAVKEGGVVLLHDIRWSSIHILAERRRRHFRPSATWWSGIHRSARTSSMSPSPANARGTRSPTSTWTAKRC